MRRIVTALGAFTAAVLAVSPIAAQQTVKIGLIMPYSGQFADTATQMDNAIKLYVKQNGDSVAGKKIEIIRKDTGGIAPDVAKRLAQELVVRDQVDILSGLILTPNALAVGDVSAQAQKFTVIMNAATSIITTKSPYMARTSTTTPMLNETLGTWAYKSGVRKIYTMVSDYGPGQDAEAAFHQGFKDAGGEIVGSVRFPVANPDFTAFVQRAKIRTRRRSTSGFPAVRSRRRSARRSPSAASTPRPRRSSGRTCSPTSMRSAAWVRRASASSPSRTTTTTTSPLSIKHS